MNAIKMSFKGHTFYANPESLKTQRSKNIAVKNVPFGFSKSKEIGRAPMIISGSGCLFYPDAANKARDLTRIFEKSGSDYLFIPHMEPVRAFFTDLSFSSTAENDYLIYEFSFTEDSTEKKERYPFGYTYVQRNENLFDVASRCGISTHKLFEANSFKDMFSAKEGDRVWLK